MKLSLTVDLMNLPSSNSPLFLARKAMQQFKEETGVFKGLLRKNKEMLANGIESQTIALQFEKCTLDIDLVIDRLSRQQFVQGFDLTENLS